MNRRTFLWTIGSFSTMALLAGANMDWAIHNSAQSDTAPNTVQDEDIPQQLEMDLSFLHEEEGQQFEVEPLKPKRNQYQATHGHESYKNVQVQSINYSGDYPWLK